MFRWWLDRNAIRLAVQSAIGRRMELFPLPERETHLVLSNDGCPKDGCNWSRGILRWMSTIASAHHKHPRRSLAVSSEYFMHALDSRSSLADCSSTPLH